MARVALLIAIGGILLEAVASETCSKQISCNGLDDEDAFSELQQFFAQHVKDGNDVTIHSDIKFVRQAPTTIVPTTPKPKPLPTSCDDVDLNLSKSHDDKGGVFDINITDIGVTEAYCDVKTEGGNWTVFQRRIDGSVDFYRNWADYVTGFGNATKEVWLGLEAIHQLTKSKDCELRIELTRKSDEKPFYAKYSTFKIGPASENYKLTVGGYSGNIQNSMAYHNNQAFSTKDKDNDLSPNSCAERYKGAWWYNDCYHSNLNGVVNAETGWKAMCWNRTVMRFTEMKLREKA